MWSTVGQWQSLLWFHCIYLLPSNGKNVDSKRILNLVQAAGAFKGLCDAILVLSHLLAYKSKGDDGQA